MKPTPASFRLPSPADCAPCSPDAERSRPQPTLFSLESLSTPRGRILLIESSPQGSRNLVLVLTAAGYEVVCSMDGRDAEMRFQDDGFDLVVLDLMLPDIDALRLCRSIRRLSRIPIVMLSARSDEDEVVEALESGADDHVRKPFRSRELLARIGRCLDRTRAVPLPEGDRASA